MSERFGPVGVGELVGGKYRVDGLLATGGMGVIVAATHVHLNIPVVLKFLTNEISENREARARFVREARAAAMIRSDHVVRVMDVNELDSVTPFLVMEYLDGCNLSDLLESSGPLPVDLAVGYVLEAGEALAAAHALGIVHRDIKPSNLFLTNHGNGTKSIKVLDFGISKFNAFGSGDAPITSTGGMMGSPMYMPPEQIRDSRDVDTRADLWSLGLVLYELLAGQPAFAADTAPALFVKIVVDPLVPLRSRRRVPEALEAVIERCLAKDRDARPATIQELATLLEPFANEEGRRSVQRILGTAGARAAPAGLTVSRPTRVERTTGSGGLGPSVPTSAAWGRTTPWALRSRRPLFIVLGALVAVGLAGLGLHAAQRVSAPLALTAAGGMPVTVEVTASTAVRAPELAASAAVAPVVSVSRPAEPKVAASTSSSTRYKPSTSNRVVNGRPSVAREEVVFDGRQ